MLTGLRAFFEVQRKTSVINFFPLTTFEDQIIKQSVYELLNFNDLKLCLTT